jgi:adenosine/AMP kinase
MVNLFPVNILQRMADQAGFKKIYLATKGRRGE